MREAIRMSAGTVLLVAAVVIGFQVLGSAELPEKQIRSLQMGVNLATSWPGESTLPSAGIMRNGPDIVVTFWAEQAATYRLERKLQITDSIWQSIPGVNDLTAASSGPAQITDPGAVSLGAAFYRVNPTRFPLTVTKTGSGVGTVTSSPTGINCGASCTASFDTGASVTLQARTSNGANSFFSGWTGDCASAGSSRDCTVSMTQSRTAGATFSSMTNNVIFASSRTYVGGSAIGGVANADNECNILATAAGINVAAGNGFLAFISSSGSNVFTRLGATPRGWLRMDGKPVFDSQAAIMAGQIWHPINRNEFGQVVTGDYYVATGMNGNGTTAGLTCVDWTSGAGQFGAFGNVNNGPGAWIQENNFGCNSTLRLYCMGKTKNAALTPTPFAGTAKYLFVSNATAAPNNVAGPAEFDAICNAEKPVGSGTFKALVASIDSAASSLVSETTNYMTIQRLLIGTGAEITSASFFASGAGMWEHSNFSFPNPVGSARVYTGSASPVSLGSAGTTCNGWGSTTGNGTYGLYQIRDRWWGISLQTCDMPAHVHCIEQ